MKRSGKKSAKTAPRARPGRATGRPTIRDVSQLAGVSRMTVSRVVRGLDIVVPETRDRVRKAIADLGYVPDRAAGSLASRRTGFIALMLPTLTNTNFAEVAHGLTEALRAADYQLLIAYTDYSVAEEERQLHQLLARRPEALVLTGPDTCSTRGSSASAPSPAAKTVTHWIIEVKRACRASRTN